MTSVPHDERDAPHAWIDELNPDDRAAFLDVGRLLINFVLQDLAAHPDEAARASDEAER